MSLRVGIGVDAHALEEGVPLVLGGVAFDHPRGLAGHSDGDVLAHALIDALLGAAGLGDIGSLFPSGDERFRGADSLELLREAYRQVREAGWALVNADCVLVGEEPQIAAHRDEMRRRLSEARRRRRGQRARDDDRPARLHRPRRGPRRARRRAARARLADDHVQHPAVGEREAPFAGRPPTSSTRSPSAAPAVSAAITVPSGATTVGRRSVLSNRRARHGGTPRTRARRVEVEPRRRSFARVTERVDDAGRNEDGGSRPACTCSPSGPTVNVTSPSRT